MNSKSWWTPTVGAVYSYGPPLQYCSLNPDLNNELNRLMGTSKTIIQDQPIYFPVSLLRSRKINKRYEEMRRDFERNGRDVDIDSEQQAKEIRITRDQATKFIKTICESELRQQRTPEHTCRRIQLQRCTDKIDMIFSHFKRKQIKIEITDS